MIIVIISRLPHNLRRNLELRILAKRRSQDSKSALNSQKRRSHRRSTAASGRGVLLVPRPAIAALTPQFGTARPASSSVLDRLDSQPLEVRQVVFHGLELF